MKRSRPSTRPKPPDRRSPSRLWRRVAVATALVTVVAIPLATSDQPWPWRAVHRLPVGHDLLMSTLNRLRGTLLPADFAIAIETACAQRADLAPSVTWVLGQPRHPRLGEVVALAGFIGLVDVEPRVRELAFDPAAPARAAAVGALERLQPIPADDLVVLLGDDDRDVVLAALGILRLRSDVGVAAVAGLIRCLHRGDARITSAALAALPEQIPATYLADITELRGHDPAAALQLLARVERVPAVSEVFAEAVVDVEREVVDARILDAVPAQAVDESLRKHLWNVATGMGSEDVRASALALLARAGDRTALPADVANWSPRLRYEAGRLGLAGGDPVAVGLLMDLGWSEDSANPELAGKARLAMSRHARIPPHAPRDQWEGWLARSGAVDGAPR